MRQLLNIVLLGSPGCGKGTIAKMIVRDFKLTHVSSSELLATRADQKVGGSTVGQIMRSGALVPDEALLDLLRTRCSELRFRGILLVSRVRYPIPLFVNEQSPGRLSPDQGSGGETRLNPGHRCRLLHRRPQAGDPRPPTAEVGAQTEWEDLRL